MVPNRTKHHKLTFSCFLSFAYYIKHGQLYVGIWNNRLLSFENGWLYPGHHLLANVRTLLMDGLFISYG